MLVLLLIWFNHYMCFVIDITSDCGPYTSKVLLFGQSCVFTILPWLEKLIIVNSNNNKKKKIHSDNDNKQVYYPYLCEDRLIISIIKINFVCGWLTNGSERSAHVFVSYIANGRCVFIKEIF